MQMSVVRLDELLASDHPLQGDHLNVTLELMVTSRECQWELTSKPRFSNRFMICPTSPRFTPSGLTSTRVRSFSSLILARCPCVLIEASESQWNGMEWGVFVWIGLDFVQWVIESYRIGKVVEKSKICKLPVLKTTLPSSEGTVRLSIHTIHTPLI